MEEINKQNENPINNSEDCSEEFEPEDNNPKVQELNPDSKEYFSLELPNGYRISLGSCFISAEGLRDIAISTYEYLTKSKPKNNGGSYLG